MANKAIKAPSTAKAPAAKANPVKSVPAKTATTNVSKKVVIVKPAQKASAPVKGATKAATPPAKSQATAKNVQTSKSNIKPTTTKAPVSKAPVSKAPVSKAPVSKAPVSKAPISKAPPAPQKKAVVNAKAPAPAAKAKPAPAKTAPASAKSVAPAKRPAPAKPAVVSKANVKVAPASNKPAAKPAAKQSPATFASTPDKTKAVVKTTTAAKPTTPSKAKPTPAPTIVKTVVKTSVKASEKLPAKPSFKPPVKTQAKPALPQKPAVQAKVPPAPAKGKVVSKPAQNVKATPIVAKAPAKPIPAKLAPAPVKAKEPIKTATKPVATKAAPVKVVTPSPAKVKTPEKPAAPVKVSVPTKSAPAKEVAPAKPAPAKTVAPAKPAPVKEAPVAAKAAVTVKPSAPAKAEVIKSAPVKVVATVEKPKLLVPTKVEPVKSATVKVVAPAEKPKLLVPTKVEAPVKTPQPLKPTYQPKIEIPVKPVDDTVYNYPKIFDKRLEQIRFSLDDQKIEALVVDYLPNVRYLTNFSGSAATLIITHEEIHFITDDRYEEQIKTELFTLPNFHTHISRDVWQYLKDSKILKKVQNIGFEADRMYYSDAVNIRNLLRPYKFKPTPYIVEPFTMPKSPEELAFIQKSAQIAEKVYEKMLKFIKPNMSEKEIALEISYQCRQMGSEGEAFPIIVTSGERGALIHGQPSDRRLKLGDILLMDYGCIVNGFCSDITRTIAIGKASKDQKRIYKILHQAKEAAINNVRPAMNGKLVDNFARSIIKKEGFGDNFQHSLGHGIGICPHEKPVITFRMDDQIVPEDVVLAIEPGIYLPDKFGMRIEDMIQVIRGGVVRITNAPDDLPVI